MKGFFEGTKSNTQSVSSGAAPQSARLERNISPRVHPSLPSAENLPGEVVS